MQHAAPSVPDEVMERIDHYGLRLLWDYSSQAWIVITPDTRGYVSAESNNIQDIEDWIVNEWAEWGVLPEDFFRCEDK